MDHMATRRSCPQHRLMSKLIKNGLHCENNNYIFTEKPKFRFEDYTRVIYYALVAVAPVLCFLNSLHGELVHDDLVAITRNPDIRPQTHLSKVFVDDFWGKPLISDKSHKSYRPLTVLTYRLNYACDGLNPVGYHIVNIALHAAATLLFTYICEHVLLRSMHLSALAGLLFAVHPVHCEAVAGVVGRADVLCCVFYLMSFLTYTRGVEHGKTRSWRHLLASMVLGSLSMMAKEQGITSLAFCAVYDVVCLSHKALHKAYRERRMVREATSFMRRLGLITSTMCVLMCFRMWLMDFSLPEFKADDNPAAFSDSLVTRMLTFSYLCSANMWMLLCPLSLSYDWQMGSIPLVESALDPHNLATLTLILCLGPLLYVCINNLSDEGYRRPLVAVSLLILPFLPASNLLFPVGFVMAERILYIPSLGLILLLVLCVDSLATRWRHYSHTLFVCVMALALMWGCRTIVRNKVWQSRQSLFLSGMQTLPSNAKMHYNYGNFLKDTGHKAEAAQKYLQAIRLWPSYASAHNNLGTVLEDEHAAEAHYRKAIKLHPEHAGAYFNLGNLMYQQGKKSQAIAALKKVILIDGDFAEAHTGLAVILNEEGRYHEAESYYHSAVKLRPHDANAHNNLGVFLANRGHTADALQSYKCAYTADPKHHISIVNAARLLHNLQKPAQANIMFEKALGLSRDPLTLELVGVYYLNSGHNQRAAQLLKETLSHNPNNLQIQIYYSQALGRLGAFQEAEDILRKVLVLDSHHLEVLHQLANILGLQKRHLEAVELLNRALQLTQKSEDDSLLPTLHFEIANHFKDLTQMHEAFEHYSKAVQLDPTLGEAHLNLGVFYHLEGRLAEARHHYMQAQRLAPDNTLIQDNLRKLNNVEVESQHLMKDMNKIPVITSKDHNS